MRVCDKCGESAYTQLHVSADESVYDLCNVHYTEFMEWVSARPKQPQRTRKTASRVSRRSEQTEET